MSKTAMIVVLAIFSMAITAPVHAGEFNNDPPAVEVKYLGKLDKNPVFEVYFNNNETDNFIVTISDYLGNILYIEKLKGANMSRKYRIATEEEIADGGLRFEVKSLKSSKTDVYSVGLKENITRSMAVSKL